MTRAFRSMVKGSINSTRSLRFSNGSRVGRSWSRKRSSRRSKISPLWAVSLQEKNNWREQRTLCRQARSAVRRRITQKNHSGRVSRKTESKGHLDCPLIDHGDAVRLNFKEMSIVGGQRAPGGSK